jgi:ElaB/YqjD/DUF883 family membrane-anchored ribosome-binding protein
MQATREMLLEEIQGLLADVDSLFRQAATAGGEEAQHLRQRAESALAQAADRFAAVEKDLLRRGREAARATDDWVHHNPWSSIGIGAGVGLLIGMLIARR